MPYEIDTNSRRFTNIPDSMPIRDALNFAKENSDTTVPLDYIGLPDRKLQMPKGTSWAALDYLDEQGVFRESEKQRQENYMVALREEAKRMDKNLAAANRAKGIAKVMAVENSFGAPADYVGNLTGSVIADVLTGEIDYMPRTRDAVFGKPVETEDLPTYIQAATDVGTMSPEILLSTAAPGASVGIMMYGGAARNLHANDVSDDVIEKPLEALKTGALMGLGAGLANVGSNLAAKAFTGKRLGAAMASMGDRTKEGVRRAGEAIAGSLASTPAGLALDWEEIVNAEDKTKAVIRTLLGDIVFTAADMTRQSRAAGIERLNDSLGESLGQGLRDLVQEVQEIQSDPDLNASFNEGIETVIQSRADAIAAESADPLDASEAPVANSVSEALFAELEAQSLTKNVNLDELPDADAPQQTESTYVATEWPEVDAPYEPATLEFSTEEADAIYSGYQKAVDESGFPDVEIASVARQSGVPIDKVRDYIWQQSKAKNAFPSEGDWSMSPEWVREGTIWHKGKHFMKVKFSSKPKREPSSEPVSADQALRRDTFEGPPKEPKEPKEQPQKAQKAPEEPSKPSAGKTIAERTLRRMREQAAKRGDQLLRITPGGTQVYDWIAKTWKRETSQGGNLGKYDKEPVESNKRRNQNILAEQFQIQATVNEFKKTLKRIKKDADFADENSLLSRAVRGVLTTEDAFAPKTVKDYMEMRTHDLSHKEFVQQRAMRVLNRIAPELVGPVGKMADHRERLTNELLKSGFFDKDKVNEKIVDLSRDIYLRRTYRVFRDLKWHEKIPEDVLARAEQAIERVFSDSVHRAAVEAHGIEYKDKFGYVTREAYEWIAQDLDLPRADSEIRQRFDGILKTFTKPDRSKHLREWMEASSGGQKLDHKALKSRSELLNDEPALRALMGEDVNPLVNYMETGRTLTNMLTSQVFLNEVAAIGDGRFLFKDNPRGDYYEKLSGKSYGPLDGYYTSPDFKAALDSANDGIGTYNGALEKAWMWASSQTKMNLTVMSPAGTIRNYLTMVSLAGMHGHLSKQSFGKAHKTGIQSATWFNSDTGTTSSAFFDEAQRLIRLGVMSSGTNTQDLRALIKYIGGDPTNLKFGPDDLNTKGIKALLKGARGVRERMIKLYQLGDDVWKINGFYVEKQRALDAADRRGKPISVDEAEAIAARKIKMIYPTYSELPVWVRRLRALPTNGSFVSWPYEVARTTFNNLKLINEELADPATRRYGAIRAFGLTAATGGLAASLEGFKMALGIDQEEADAVRNIVAPWDKFGQYLFLSRPERDPKKGPWILNLRNLDYLSYLKEPINAAIQGLRDNDPLGAAIQAFKQASDPFISVDVFTQVAGEAWAGQTKEGKPIWRKSADTEFERFEKSMEHIWNVVKPGFFKSIDRMRDQQRSTGFEVFAFVSGQRPVPVSPWNATLYGGYRYNRAKQEISSAFREDIKKSKNPDDWVNTFRKKEARYRQNWQEMRKVYVSSRRLGLTQQQMGARMKSAGLQPKEIRSIMNGLYEPMDFLKALNSDDSVPKHVKKTIAERAQGVRRESFSKAADRP